MARSPCTGLPAGALESSRPHPNPIIQSDSVERGTSNSSTNVRPARDAPSERLLLLALNALGFHPPGARARFGSGALRPLTATSSWTLKASLAIRKPMLASPTLAWRMDGRQLHVTSRLPKRKPRRVSLRGPCSRRNLREHQSAATNRWQRPTRWADGARPSCRHRFNHLLAVPG